MGLPDEVGGERAAGTVGHQSLAPVGDQLRALHGVRREQSGQAARDGVATVAAHRLLLAVRPVPEVARQVGAPGLVEGVVDGREQRPDEPVGVPQVVAVTVEQQRDQRARVEEPDAGTDTVAAARSDAEPVGEPLGEPALDTLGGHHHDLVGERVVQRCGEQLAEAVGELVGARGAVEVERHRQRP